AWVGCGIAWAYFGPNAVGCAERFAASWSRLHRALVNKLYVDELYDAVIVRPLWALARIAWSVVDKTIIDGLLVDGSAALVRWVAALARRFQNGDVQRYAAITAVGVAQ